VLTPASYVMPITQLMRSPYGDAHWSPFDDSITYEPFVRPTLAYFTGQLFNVTTKGGAQTALNAAQSTDIVQFEAAMSWTRSSTPNVAQLSFPARSSGYVMVRDLGTHATLPTQGTRVSDADFAAANVQSVSANDSMWDFAPSTQGWYFRGLELKNANADCTCILRVAARNPTTGNGVYTVATMPRYVIIEQCRIWNPYDAAAWTTGCRNGIEPGMEFGYITDNQITGIVGNGTENKGLNTSNGIGKLCVTNNAIEASTENIMWGGSTQQGDNPNCACADIHISRNYLYRRAEWMVFSATAFVYRNHKNFMEHKKGERVCWERNECVGHSGIGQAQCVNIKHAGVGTSDVGLVRTRNIVIRYNRFKNGAAPIAISTSTNATYTPNGTERVEFYGNLWQDQHAQFVNTTLNRNLLADIATNVKVITDVYVHHNTMSVRHNHCVFAGNLTSNAGALPNFRWMNNVDFSPTHNYGGFQMNNSVAGVTALNNVAGVNNWIVAGNVGINAGAPVFSGVPGNYVVSAGSLAFVDAAGGNYTLVDYSAYPATDGGAPGVPFAHLTTMLTGVLTGARA
jgi:hypothetical protein